MQHSDAYQKHPDVSTLPYAVVNEFFIPSASS